MSKVNIISHQSILDLANQETGSIETAFDWALQNNISLTEVLQPGQVLEVPKSDFKSDELTAYFKRNKKTIATGLTQFEADNDDVEDSFGIGSMIIESTFIVR